MTIGRLSGILLALVLLPAGAAQAQVKIGVITSTTGPTALIGLAHRNSVALLPQEAGGKTITYVNLDDASDPTATVAAVRKLIEEERVDAIIGPSGTPNAIAAVPFVAGAGTPLLAPVGSAAVVQPMDDQRRWVFKITLNDDLIARAIVDHMAAAGVKTVSYMGTADPYGENWLAVFSEMAAAAGLSVVSSESFQRTDTTVTAQVLKTLLAKPDAVLIAAPGAAAALPQTTLFDQGYGGSIYQTHGAAFDQFLQIGGAKVEGTLLAASGFMVADILPESNPIRAVGMRYLDGYKARYGEKAESFGASVYDAGLLLEAAIPAALEAAEPGTAEFRAALRDAIERTRDVVGAQGIYSMTEQDHSGLDGRAVEMIAVKDGQWSLVR